ncbi:MAG: iron-containing alcohol dehydrogenase, partial [Oscillospiraceae bacterium]|nr:iron-containing alcohol dehydrogenase [Oscillospiraceae bacterium]
GLAIVSIPYYKYIYKYGLDKFVRFAKKVWGVDTDSMTKEEAALAGIDKLADFIKEMGIPTTLREIGATEDMLPLIAESTIPGGGYKQIGSAEILEILRQCY